MQVSVFDIYRLAFVNIPQNVNVWSARVLLAYRTNFNDAYSLLILALAITYIRVRPDCNSLILFWY